MALPWKPPTESAVQLEKPQFVPILEEKNVCVGLSERQYVSMLGSISDFRKLLRLFVVFAFDANLANMCSEMPLCSPVMLRVRSNMLFSHTCNNNVTGNSFILRLNELFF